MTRRQFGTVRQLPSGRYQARYRNGFGVMVTGTTTFKTKGDAHRWLTTIEADLLRGSYVDPRAGRIKFTEWAEEWLTTKPGQRAQTIARDRVAIETHFKPTIGQMPLSTITPTHIRALVETMQARGLAPKSVRTYVGTLQAIFRAAVDSDLLARSPVRTRTLGLKPIVKHERPTLTPTQLRALADAVPPRFNALILLVGTVGLRWGEAIGLRVQDIDFLRRRISVVQTVEEVGGRVEVVEHTKTDAARRSFSLPAFLVDELAAHLAAHRPNAEPDDLVFIGAKGGLLRRNFEARTFRPAAKAAKLPDTLTFHGLRHVATSLMITNNEHPKVIQHRLGHADPAISLGIYGHVADDVDRAAAQRLQDLFETAHDDTAEGQGDG